VSLLPPIPTNFRAATALPPLIKLDRRTDVLLRTPALCDVASPQTPRRSRIWELAETLHCSIIGTCLSNAELRHALARLGVNGIEAADDHELHVVGVMLAGRRDAGAKLLQRALDRRHAVAIKQYAKARDEDALRQLWDASMRSGDIPGAYWALLSHAAAAANPADCREEDGARRVIADLNRKLGQETTRRERLEQRLHAMSDGMRTLEASFQAVQGERDALRREIESLEDHIAGLLQPATGDGEAALDLSTRTILYVGGRPNQIPQLKALVERTGARFLHHDGGIEHSSSLLPGLISRADVLLFPIDCISHDAVATLKRLCRQLEKPYLPLRAASLATLASSLAGINRGP
jgi:hypothetical protein